jgi:hypothetical protein
LKNIRKLGNGKTTKIILQKYDLKIDFLNKLHKIDKLSKKSLFAMVFVFKFDLNI